MVHVLSDEEREGYEHGFVTAELIKKYAGEGEYSVLMCGPKAMYDFCVGECKKLGLPKRLYRAEMSGDYMGAVNNADYPKDQIGRRIQPHRPHPRRTHQNPLQGRREPCSGDWSAPRSTRRATAAAASAAGVTPGS